MLCVLVVVCVVLANCGGGGAAGTAVSGAPRMVRQQGSPPPTVTVVPTVGPSADQPVSYHLDVQPILTSACGSCHGGQGGFWVDNYELVMRGGDSGAAVVPDKPEQSDLYLRITGKSTPAMPLNSPPLSQSEINAIRDWIAEGAPKN